MARLHGKIALVTGAASGIGQAVVGTFLAQGATVIATDVAPLPFRRSGTVLPLRLDTPVEADWSAAMVSVVEICGPLDILVNNAGISASEPAPIRDIELDDWRRVLAVNLDGVFLGMKHAMRAMEGRGGAIVNIASMLSFVAIPNSPAYCASKGGVLQLTRAGALEGAAMSPQIRVNSVQPGYVETQLVLARFAQTPEARALIEGQTPAGRLATPGEIASAVSFLASDEASYMTGAGLTVDGGYTAR